MIPAIDNIFILRGDTFSRTYNLFQGRAITITGAVAATGSTATINAKTEGFSVLMDAVATGRKLLVGEQILTLSGSGIVRGATSFQVGSVEIAIAANTTAYVLADLTGATGRARITKGSFAINPTVAINGDRLLGEVTISLTATQTATVPASLSASELQQLTPEALQDRQQSSKDYLWDWDLTFGDNTVITPYRGLCIVGEDIAE